MSIDLLIFNYMGGSGGEFLLTLVNEKDNRPQNYVTYNRYKYQDLIKDSAFTLEEWCSALHAGYTHLDDYMFDVLFEQDFKRYHYYMEDRGLYSLRNHSTFEEYCRYLLEELGKKNQKYHGLACHYNRSVGGIKLNEYMPSTKVINISTKNVSTNFFRLLFLLKVFLTKGHGLQSTDFNFYVKRYLYLNEVNYFDSISNDEFSIDYKELFFDLDKSIDRKLSDFLGRKIELNFDKIHQYTLDNFELLKNQLNYSFDMSESKTNLLVEGLIQKYTLVG